MAIVCCCASSPVIALPNSAPNGTLTLEPGPRIDWFAPGARHRSRDQAVTGLESCWVESAPAEIHRSFGSFSCSAAVWEEPSLQQRCGQIRQQDALAQVQLQELRHAEPNDEFVDLGAFVSRVRHLGRTMALSDGRRLHAQLTSEGYEQNTLVANCLVQMYGNCGNLEDAQAVFDKIAEPNIYSWNILITAYVHNCNIVKARKVFDSMTERNVVSWSAMVAAYAQNGHCEEALQLFLQMQRDGIKPNKIAFLCVLEACANLAALSEGWKIHATVVQSGFEPDVLIGSALVTMYASCRSLTNAQSAFFKVPQHTVVSWNAIISAYARNGLGNKALQIFHQMQRQGVEANSATFMAALNACAVGRALADVQEIHAAVLECGLYPDVAVWNTLINVYGKCGSLESAKSLFNRMPEQDLVSWNVMITVCTQNRHSKEALELFRHMQMNGFVPNAFLLACVLNACACLGALIEGQEVHATIVERGLEKDLNVGISLINMYGKCRSVDHARIVFDQMSSRNLVLWTAMIAVCSQNGCNNEALELFRQMKLEGVQPNNVTLTCVLDACASLGALEEGYEIHTSVVESGIEPDVGVETALVHMYAKCGSIDNARIVFGRMAQHDVVSWSAMVAAYAQNGHSKEALEHFCQMQREGSMPNEVTFVCVLDACASIAALHEGRETHDLISKCGCELDVFVGTALVNMYGKCGCITDAKDVFARMSQRNVISWNAMIAAYAQNGHDKEAMKLLGQMQQEGVKPDSDTFMCVLTACSHSGQIVDGMNYFVTMSKDHGIINSVEHYLCLVDLLGRAGHLNEAEQLINSMPYKSVAVAAWSILLGACRIHGDVERGVRVADRCFKPELKDAGRLVQLSNLFAVGAER